jgi:hypothetical protein
LETMSEDDFAYEDIKATRMATINQIKTIKWDIENRKSLFAEYKTIITQIRKFLGI